jgi:hypothetical protein
MECALASPQQHRAAFGWGAIGHADDIATATTTPEDGHERGSDAQKWCTAVGGRVLSMCPSAKP